jgi:hypothetical protein
MLPVNNQKTAPILKPAFLIPLLLAVLLPNFILPTDSLKIDDDEFELNLQLIKHQPCPFKPEKSKWERKLEFEAGTDQMGPKLLPRPNETNVKIMSITPMPIQ